MRLIPIIHIQISSVQASSSPPALSSKPCPSTRPYKNSLNFVMPVKISKLVKKQTWWKSKIWWKFWAFWNRFFSQGFPGCSCLCVIFSCSMFYFVLSTEHIISCWPKLKPSKWKEGSQMKQKSQSQQFVKSSYFHLSHHFVYFSAHRYRKGCGSI